MYMEFFLLHKNCKPQNKIEAAILHSNDIGTFNCVLCDLIAHLTFLMRKVLVIRNSNQTTRHFSAGGCGRLGTRLGLLQGTCTEEGWVGTCLVPKLSCNEVVCRLPRELGAWQGWLHLTSTATSLHSEGLK